jgi:ADP-ribose pyrophosphatase YjhB (NUDIX family)
MSAPHRRPRALDNQPGQDLSFSVRRVEREGRERLTCDRCDYVHYVNPVVVVGVVVTVGHELLLCRRDIDPRSGYWTMPAGFLEEGESSEEGACREAREEALAEVDVDALLAVYDIPHISQIQLIYRGTLRGDRYGVGEETREVRLFAPDEIPWDELAFPSVRWALQDHARAQGLSSFAPFRTPSEGHPGR